MRISLSSSRNQDTRTFPLGSNRKIIEWMRRRRGIKKKIINKGRDAKRKDLI